MGVWALNKNLVYLMMFCSGFAGLIYEIIWLRVLGVFFGVSSFAIATVVGVFLLGLGIGAFLFGRISEKNVDVVKLYAFLELAISAFSLFAFFALGMDFFGFVHNYAYNHFSFYAFSTVRFAIAFIILIIPCALMGGTIPVLARHLLKSSQSLGRDFSALYYANSFGAVLGIVAVGFFLVRIFGVFESFAVALSINILIFLAITILNLAAYSKKKGFYKSAKNREANKTNKMQTFLPKNLPKIPGKKRSIIPFILMLTGFLTAGFELLWARLVSIFGTATNYSFTAILGGFIAGIALGSFVFRKKSDEGKGLNLLLVLFTGSAAFGSAVLAFFSTRNWLLDILQNSIVLELSVGFIISAGISLFFGASFPLLVRLYSKNAEKAGQKTGNALLYNSIGAVLGSIITGFVAVPFFGIKFSGIGLVIISVLVAGISFLSIIAQAKNCLFSLKDKKVILSSMLFILFIVFFVAVLLNPGHFFKALNSNQKIVFYEEGISATVTVSEDKNRPETGKILYIDSRPVAGTSLAAIIDAKMLAHIPLAVAKSHDEVLTVGYGTGVTSHSMLLHGSEVYAVEIEEKVLYANKEFSDINHEAIENRSFHIIVDDARNYLQSTDKKFDVIVTDVTGLKYKSNPYLYTTDYFSVIKNTLKKNGTAAAWIPLSHLSFRDLQILTASFRQAFPHTTMWTFSRGMTTFAVLVGTPEKLSVDLKKINSLDAKVREDLDSIKIGDEYFFGSMLFLGEEDIAELIENVPLHTDNKPVLEFSDVKDYYKSNIYANTGLLMHYQKENLSSYFSGNSQELNLLENAFKEKKSRIESSINASQKSSAPLKS